MLRQLSHYRFFTIPNLLTLSRIALTPLLGYYIALSNTQADALKKAMVVGILMILSDFLDGFLARALGQQTPVGQYLDPIADKISSLITLFFLYCYKEYPLWIFLLIILREVAGTFGGIWILLKRKILAKPNYWGKSGIFFIALNGMFYLLDLPYKQLSLIPVVITLVGGVMTYSKRYFKEAFFPDNP